MLNDLGATLSHLLIPTKAFLNLSQYVQTLMGMM